MVVAVQLMIGATRGVTVSTRGFPTRMVIRCRVDLYAFFVCLFVFCFLFCFVFFLRCFNILCYASGFHVIVLSSDVFDEHARAHVCMCVVHWHCTVQLSMFNMEKRFRNKIIIIIIIFINGSSQA